MVLKCITNTQSFNIEENNVFNLLLTPNFNFNIKTTLSINPSNNYNYNERNKDCIRIIRVINIFYAISWHALKRSDVYPI